MRRAYAAHPATRRFRFRRRHNGLMAPQLCLAREPEADQLLSADPFALLLAVRLRLDQQSRALRTVYKVVTTLAVDNGHSGDLQAYYLIVPPGGKATKAEKKYSEHVFKGPLQPGVGRDSYGPTGGF